MAAVANNNRRHDIRTAIPLTKMTNPADFPEHIHRDYPLMLTQYVDVALPGKKEPLRKVVPVLDEVDQPIIVSSEDELETYLGNLEDEAKAEEIRSLLPRSSADAKAETDAALSRMASENAKLRAMLAKQGVSLDDGDETEETDGNALSAITPTRLKPKPGKKDTALPARLKASAK